MVMLTSIIEHLYSYWRFLCFVFYVCRLVLLTDAYHFVIVLDYDDTEVNIAV